MGLAGLASGCSRTPQPSFVPVGPSAAARLEMADELVREGCLDCLLAAYREYNSIRTSGSVSAAATAGSIRAAALIDLRERELGLPRGEYLSVAMDDAQTSPALSSEFGQLLEIASLLRLGPGGARPTSDEQVAAMLQLSRQRAEWTGWLEARARREVLAAAVWVSFACDPLNSRTIGADRVLSAVGEARDAPLIVFTHATSCIRGDSTALQMLLDRDPRFGEIHYLLGLASLGLRPDVDGADLRFRQAYEWRRDWPALTQSIGNLALATEDFERAFEFFDRTLALVPEQPDALVGKIRALTYSGRYAEALDTADALLATGRNPGEARYWRAFDANQLGRTDEAWADVEIARTLIVNAEVPKLAGVIAYRRGEIELARRKLEEARSRNAADCETAFYLQLVLAEQANWAETAAMAAGAAQCFTDAEARLRQAIAALLASNAAPERLRRQVARREQEIAANGRMRATAWFNAAVSTFNLGRTSDARDFASRVADDEQFGARARAILLRVQ
jgi:tetratricopeptide (TPR) repeat protein